jgi:hypothetical protein
MVGGKPHLICECSPEDRKEVIVNDELECLGG